MYGKYYVVDEDGSYWRLMDFITGTVAYEKADSLDMLRKSGAAFGKFQSMLSDYPAENLNEVIKDFHNTPVRFEQLKTAVSENRAKRVETAQNELNFALEREEAASELTDMLLSGKLALKVTHNDTKMANILVDEKTDEPVCVIDLDTIMPGLVAYDFGDSIRSVQQPHSRTRLIWTRLILIWISSELMPRDFCRFAERVSRKTSFIHFLSERS